MRKLLLCCGPTRPPGYVRLDVNPAHDPDILAAIRAALAEITRLREELRSERQFCLCGCPIEHHSATEDGLECDEHPDFECVLVCAAARTLWDRLLEENERLKARDGLLTAVENVVNTYGKTDGLPHDRVFVLGQRAEAAEAKLAEAQLR